ncbi:unnamed protein product [Rhizoctonia solani]|uniref:Uncharacterized protein n=1 Tax=Rhizoctonia solani TaxID=456999 RepID=A0A8H3GYQ9_9AGAM|nr:unnamed protein product [Rhizoctonia solani]
MSNIPESQAYNSETLQWVMGQDGLTYVYTPTGELVAAVAWLQIPDGEHDRATIDYLVHHRSKQGYML